MLRTLTRVGAMAAVFERLPDIHIGQLNLTDVARETIKELADDDVPGLAAEMAYHSILAIFPLLLFLAGLTSIVEPLRLPNTCILVAVVVALPVIGC